jgi:hypothetical protein
VVGLWSFALGLSCGEGNWESVPSVPPEARAGSEAPAERPEEEEDTTPQAPRQVGPDPVLYPDAAGWTFYGTEQGAPRDVHGVTEDEGGNLWVAGGEEGLFLLRPGASRFERFTLEDGLRPYGFLEDGSAPVGPRFLKVIAVTGGPPGTVFVGYQGQPGCENNYYLAGRRDPNIYKSGDADKVTLTDEGIRVVHYDLSSGGREKFCSVLRIAWDKRHGHLWFGANHGFAWGDPDYQGPSACDGQGPCAGVLEHAHPHLEGRHGEQGRPFLLTDAYHGIAVRPDGDVWFGGAYRSTRFRFMTNDKAPRDFERARQETELRSARKNRLDIWPDAAPEESLPTREQRVDDRVSGMALMPDGTLWVGSFAWGLARLDEAGTVLRYEFNTGTERFVSALARDSRDDSLWVGHRWGGGLSRLKGGTRMSYERALGPLAKHPVQDIQSVGSGPRRRLLVAFGRTASGRPGAIGLYAGE